MPTTDAERLERLERLKQLHPHLAMADGPPPTRLEQMAGNMVAICFLLGAGYAVKTHWHSLLLRVWVLMVVGSGLILPLISKVWRRAPAFVEMPFVLIAGIGSFGGGLYGAVLGLKDLALVALASEPGIRAGLVLIGGLAAYTVRHHASVLYGFVELGVGVWLGMQKLLPKHFSDLVNGDFEFAFAALTAGVYLVVRGCDNIEKGWRNSERQDKLVRKLRPWLAEHRPTAGMVARWAPSPSPNAGSPAPRVSDQDGEEL